MFRNLLIGVAVFGLGWGASFGAGAAYGRRSIPQVQAATVTGNQLGAGGQVGQAGQAALVGRGATVGTVASNDGKTITVTGQNNQQVKVTLNDQTRILKEAAGTAADLVAGTRVTVQPQGQPAADGSLTAAAVQIIPEGVVLGGGQGQGQQGGQRQGGQGAAQGGQRAPGNQGG